MNLSVDKTMFRSNLERFSPDRYAEERILALYSAALCLSDDSSMEKMINIGLKFGLKRDAFYEMVLQSYLFCGFPRMLEAAKILDSVLPSNGSQKDIEKISEEESQQWYQNGVELCRRVYKDKYEPLKEKVLLSAPDVFRWMIVEGYGKVLSRQYPGIICRELAVVAVLMIENRKKQLHSHILGALNVGCSRELLSTVIEDIGRAAGEGYDTVLEILRKSGN